MSNANDVLNIALNEVGYLEKASNSNLDSKMSNAGSANYTKYARDLVKEVGSPYANGVAWCDIFVDWCFIRAYGLHKAKDLLGGFSAYTPTSAEYFKKMNRWTSVDPRAGDVIFFKNDIRIYHTGIVYKVDGTRIYTIEGNTSSGTNTVIANGGGVFKKSYLKNNPKIAGFGRPLFDETASMSTPISNLRYGIDISANQGVVNFSTLKNQNISFVVLRSTTKNGQPDAYFERYFNGCKIYGLDYSCYKYSYAVTPEQAIEEAKSVINLLKGRKMTIWYDVENEIQINNIGKAGLTNVCLAFLNYCANAGFDVGIYCNLNWYKNYISDDLKKKYKFWIARYGKNNGTLDMKYKPTGAYAWQYTSVGVVDGISGNVDLNVIL